MTQADKLHGKIFGRYRIDQLIGDGGQAVVYKAWHADFESWVALKFLQEHVAKKTILRERFKREARLQFKLQHPHIIRVIEIIEEGDLMGMAMDWVEGPDLDRYLYNKGQPLQYDELARIFLPVLAAVGYAHQHQVIHRDLKPSNILLGGTPGQEIPKVMDFGIAKSLEDESQHTKTNSVLGTPHYIAPEQAKSTKNVDHRADIYALGITLYQLISGRLPFEGRDMLQILGAHLMEQPPAFSSWGIQADPALEAIVQHALAKEPEQRFQTCEEFAAALLEHFHQHASDQGLFLPPSSGLYLHAHALSPPPQSFSSAPLSSPSQAGTANTGLSQQVASLPTGNFSSPRTPALPHSNSTQIAQQKRRSPVWAILLLLFLLPAVAAGLYFAEIFPFNQKAEVVAGQNTPANSMTATPPTTPTPQAAPVRQVAAPLLATKSSPLMHQPPAANPPRKLEPIPTKAPLPFKKATHITKKRRKRPIKKKWRKRKKISQRKVVVLVLPQRKVVKPLPLSCRGCLYKQLLKHITNPQQTLRNACTADILLMTATQCASSCGKKIVRYCRVYGRLVSSQHFQHRPPPPMQRYFPYLQWKSMTRKYLKRCLRLLMFERASLFPSPTYEANNAPRQCTRAFLDGWRRSTHVWKQQKRHSNTTTPNKTEPKPWEKEAERIKKEAERFKKEAERIKKGWGFED